MIAPAHAHTESPGEARIAALSTRRAAAPNGLICMRLTLRPIQISAAHTRQSCAETGVRWSSFAVGASGLRDWGGGSMSCPGVMSRRRGKGGPWERGAVVTRPGADALDVRDAVLRYDVRGNDAGARPVLLLMGHWWVPPDSAPRPGVARGDRRQPARPNSHEVSPRPAGPGFSSGHSRRTTLQAARLSIRIGLNSANLSLTTKAGSLLPGE